MTRNSGEAGTAQEVLARLGMTAEDLLAGRVPHEQRAGYQLGSEAAPRVSRRRERKRTVVTARLDSAIADSRSAVDDALVGELETSDPQNDSEEPESLKPVAQEELARTIALRKLTAAPQSRAMLAEAITAKGVSEEVAGRVLDRFTQVGLVDDAEYAAMLVRTRHSERHQARFAIAQELRRRGIDPETARQALDQIDDADEKRSALAFASKKMRSMRGLEPQVQRRRLMGALSRRGFRAGIVHYAISQVVTDSET